MTIESMLTELGMRSAAFYEAHDGDEFNEDLADTAFDSLIFARIMGVGAVTPFVEHMGWFREKMPACFPETLVPFLLLQTAAMNINDRPETKAGYQDVIKTLTAMMRGFRLFADQMSFHIQNAFVDRSQVEDLTVEEIAKLDRTEHLNRHGIGHLAPEHTALLGNLGFFCSLMNAVQTMYFYADADGKVDTSKMSDDEVFNMNLNNAVLADEVVFGYIDHLMKQDDSKETAETLLNKAVADAGLNFEIS